MCEGIFVKTTDSQIYYLSRFDFKTLTSFSWITEELDK